MSKIRVYELAKELNVSSKDLINLLMEEFGVEVKNHMSVIEDEDATLIKELLGDTSDSEGKKSLVDEYEEELAKHTVSIQVLGIGSDGHIAFNEPGTPFDSVTHVAELTEQTISDNARFFEGDKSQVPTKAVTMGLASIMRAKKIILIATGANKADAVYGMLKGEKTIDCPASILQDHADVTVIMDEAAASKL